LRLELFLLAGHGLLRPTKGHVIPTRGQYRNPPSFRTEQADAFAFPIPSEESVGLWSEKSLVDLGATANATAGIL
jgi:hypothetical protein